MFISSATVPISPLIAAKRAFSKLIFLPVSNSASNSADILSSKFNSELAILSACSKFIPTDLACAAALPKASVEPPSDNLIALETLAVSFNNCLTLIATPFCADSALAPAKNPDTVSSTLSPVPIDILLIAINSSLVYPACSLNLVNVFKSSLLISTLAPSVLLIAV